MKSLYYKNLNTLWNTNGDIHVYLTEKALGASDNKSRLNTAMKPLLIGRLAGPSRGSA